MTTETANIVQAIEEAHTAMATAWQALKETSAEIASLIEETAPLNVTLPRGYRVIKVTSSQGSERFLVKGDPSYDFGLSEDDEPIWVDGIGGYLHLDYNVQVPAPTRDGLIEFAQDVEDGLLQEITDHIRGLTAELDDAVKTLRTANRQENV